MRGGGLVELVHRRYSSIRQDTISSDDPPYTQALRRLRVGRGILVGWQADRAAERRRAGEDPRPFHVTRMWPKREPEIVAGGSLYWVIKGLVLGRQRILALERRAGEDGIRAA